MSRISKNRYVNTEFWDDGWIKKLKVDEKFLYLYLLTNPLTNICGIYEISPERMSFDTGMDLSRVIEILRTFSKGKRVKYSQGHIAIRKFIKHQAKNSKIRIGIETLLKEAPKPLAQWVEGYPMHSSSRDIDSPSHLNTNPNTNINFNYKTGKFEGITDEYKNQLDDKYPGVDIEGEIAKMEDWLQDNPSKKRQGKRSFINRWLGKAMPKVETKGLQKLPQGKEIK